ncbi:MULTISPECIES: uroporphyrinogen-III synthase [Flectobacillus]|jgi:uroporphyrinogen-III synthase|uniref:Uroporphyrinogen-III synthase n=1 Tax=Flectobacillus roseus TaxID=502259 RepID=A0ABT6YEU4_9BACT|nr:MULTISPECIES: uroporphyrinogen-III synthase [Flectobacillus]MDI9862114.1 uroporphyrinogen-III synthase [Flectobacillus roseus]MDI9870415.1 uroporphyrinogen-III synthase [Flectobacillus roseus]NBA74947.1 uroporphyrinogen-III synthase [Emticicia sp. ODNR4P]PAC31980.1 uroporphyrinogen-III synthase [Flectobacillus sp. BAB-3569]
MSETTVNAHQDRLTKVSSILVSQARPTDEKSPYFELAKRYNIKVDFRPFIEIQGVSFKDFRKQKINILDHTAIIFTSRNAVDHFFRICKEARIEVPADMKYFCITEQTAIYLQKYIVIRKRKIFSGQKTAADLLELIKKHKSEKFLFPCSDKRRNDIPEFMGTNDLHLTEAVMYETVSADLSDLEDVYYDILAFFSPSGIKSLFDNFPDFQQNKTRIAAFGPTTAKAVTDAGLFLDIQAPLPNAPSMSGALELYIKKVNGL